MASTGDLYLPDVAKSFAGEVAVFSWEDAYHYLTSGTGQAKVPLLRTLISSSKSKHVLSQTVPQFPPSSPQSRSQFETSTAAINVTPPAGNNHDITELKADTLWLSGEVKVSEEEALRIAMLEWQRQPAEILQVGYSEAELAGLREALGSQDTNVDRGVERIFPKRNDAEFNTKSQKQKRLLNTYFREQAAVLGVSRQLQELASLRRDVSSIASNLSAFAHDLYQSNSTGIGFEAIANAVEHRLQSLSSGKTWSPDIEDINDAWVASELLCVQILQEILLLRIRNSPESVQPETLLRWLHIMEGCAFFANLQPGPFLAPSCVERLQAMSSLTTLAMMDPATVLGTLTDPSRPIDPTAYFIHADTALEVHTILFRAAESCIPQAALPALAWALILSEIQRAGSAAKEARESGAVQRVIDQAATYDSATGRRASTGSLQQSVYEDVFDSLMVTSPVSDPTTYLLRCTVEACHALDVISLLARISERRPSLLNAMRLQILQELISVAVTTMGYTPEILASQFAVLSASSTNSSPEIPDARETFIADDLLMDSMFAVAAARFPYESLPFLKLCRLLSTAKVFDAQGTQYITFRLKTLESFTQLAVGSLASYHTIREDENLNLVALDEFSNMLQGYQKKLLTHSQIRPSHSIISAGTVGEVISESSPPVVKWQHSYSGLALLGAWLELHYLGQLQSILLPYESADEVVTEIISTFTALLNSTLEGSQAHLGENDLKRLQNEILDEAGSSLKTESDVADYIFDILEQELQAYRRRPSNVFNTAVLVACIDFVSVLSRVRADQFWASFSKSSLLDSYGSDSFLLSIVTGVEIPNHAFNVLESCSKLHHNIIQAAMQHARSNHVGTRTITVRKPQPQTIRLQANVVLSVTKSLYRAFEGIPGWHFASYHQQCRIVSIISSSFEKIINTAHSVGQVSSALTSSCTPASDFLIQQIRLDSDELISTTSILRHLFRSEELRAVVQEGINLGPPTDALQPLLSLSRTLVRLGKQKSQTSHVLEQQLFSAVPLLCRNLARPTGDRSLLLIQDLLVSMQHNESMSLLGHLGSVSSISLAEVLKLRLGNQSETLSDVSIWEVLAKFVGRNQQWLAIVILTGSPPERGQRDGTESSQQSSLRGKTFMEIALSQLTKINELNPAVAVAVLDFVTQAQQNWSWATRAVEANRNVLPAILSHVCNTYVDASDELRTSRRNKFAALVTDFCTIRLHYAKAARDTTTLRAITPLLRWLAEKSIDVASYKQSLHSNLKKNFASKFTGLELSDFKRTGLLEAPYGDKYYYDIDFADEILGHEQHWDRNDRYRDQSFRAEFCRANLNLSVVDSEVTLLHSFLNLSVEHSGYFAQDHELQKTMAEIIKNCLDANTQAYPSERVFENVFQTRVDLAMALLQRLVEARARGNEMRTLLKSAWECAQFRNGSFESAIVNNDLTYWRSMLKIILLTLQFQTDRRYMPPAADASPAALLRHSEQSTYTILEIITVVVGRGIRSVALALQDQKQLGKPSSEAPIALISYKDVSLVLTIFETILQMTRLPEFISEASQRLIAESAIHSGLLLCSWSHLLTGPEFDDEPVYAACSLQFLASLSSLPPVAEELAVEGVLSRLLSARVVQKLQGIPDGAGHLDRRPQVQKLYGLWATGMLPICLNLLHSVGAPVATEVSIFLNQFPYQLSRANSAFIPATQLRSRNGDSITWAVANEAANLALISFILNSYRNAGASAAVDPSRIQTLAGYDEEKKALTDDVSDLVNSTTASLKSRTVATNEKELLFARESGGEGLVQRVVSELRNALTCLKGLSTEEDSQ